MKYDIKKPPKNKKLQVYVVYETKFKYRTSEKKKN